MTRNRNILWPIVLCTFWVWVLNPGKILGKLYPVVTEVSMTSHPIAFNPGWSEVSGSFIKERDACRPLRMEWILGTRIDPGPPVEYVWGKPEVRFEGEQVFEDWKVRVSESHVFKEETFADVIHKCAIVIGSGENKKRFEFPWETHTAFWN